MDPVSLIFSLALKNPDLAAKAADSYARPGAVSGAQLESSAADFAREVINSATTDLPDSPASMLSAAPG